MAINALLGISGSSNSNYLYGISQNLITQSTSMDSQIYSALQKKSTGTSSTTTADEAYKDIDSFLKTYQSDLSKLQEDASALMKSNSKSVFSLYEKGKAELDDVVSAVGDFVESYNSVTSLLKDNAERGTGTASHLSSFTRGLASESTMQKLLGITYDEDGKMVLDSEKLKESLEKDYKAVSSMIGGQYGLADRASMKADHALNDSVQRIVGNDLSSLASSTQNFDSIQYMNNFSKSGAYSLGNMYAVGLFFSTMA